MYKSFTPRVQSKMSKHCLGQRFYIYQSRQQMVLSLYYNGSFSRKVISWTISSKPDVDLIMTAFKKAYNKRNHPEGLMFHSDRGSQYTAFAFRQLLDSLNVVQSFSKKGYPFDNACCECFFKYLKKEETNRRTYHSLQELQLSIFEYIEGFYNSKRPHGSLGMLTPNQKEELFWNQA